LKKLLLIFVLLFSQIVFSQTKKIDSLKNIIKNSSNDSLIMMTYNKLRRATVYTDPEKSAYYNNQYLKIAIQRKDSIREALGYMYMGNINVAKSDFKEALNYYFKAANYFELKKDSSKLSSTLNGIGAAYINNGKDSLSLKYFKKSQKISISLGNVRRSAIALNNISSIYANRKDFISAKKYAEQAFKEINQTKKLQYKILIAINLANIYTELKEFKKADLLYKETSKKIDTIKDTYNHALIQKSLGNLNLAKCNNKLALHYLNRAYIKFEKAKYFDETYNILLDLIKANQANKNYKLALQLFYKYNKIKDSVFTIEKDKNLTNSLTKYETVKKDAQLKVFKLESEKSKQQKKLLLFLAISGLLFTGLISFFLYKNKKKNKQIKESLNEKEMLLKEIHHRVKNNLQVVSSLLNLQQRQVKNKKTKLLFQESRDRVKAMSLIHQNLHQDNNLTVVDIKTYFENLVSNLVKNYKVVNQHKIEVKYNIESLKLDIDIIIPLGLIVNELISNILKHAFKNQEESIIKIDLTKNDNKVILTVEDNGIGMPKGFIIKETSSLGFKLIKAFSQKLNAKLTVNNSDKGAKISIKIPYKNE
jgi:two-component sensor histidine kinase